MRSSALAIAAVLLVSRLAAADSLAGTSDSLARMSEVAEFLIPDLRLEVGGRTSIVLTFPVVVQVAGGDGERFAADLWIEHSTAMTATTGAVSRAAG